MGSNPGRNAPYVPWEVALFNGNYLHWAGLARGNLGSGQFKARFPQAEALLAGCSKAAGIAHAAREYEPGLLWACGVGFIGALFPAVRAGRLPLATALRAT